MQRIDWRWVELLNAFVGFMTDHVIHRCGFRTIRMNRPDKKNALTLAMYEAMAAAPERANAIDTVQHR